jgi:uncharacterized membrane protein YccC
MTSQANAINVVWHRLRDELKIYWEDDRARFRHIAKVAIALTLATGICMHLELGTPATAMVSCIIAMMHQQSGMVIARGFYRGLGMVSGSFAGVFLIIFFPQEPLLFLITLAAWIGLCVFGASYYRNFQSYGFVLSGYGTAITVIPVLSDPYLLFNRVVYTVSEVIIGVVCASVTSALIFPQPVKNALYVSSRKNLTELLNAMHAMLDRATTVSGFDTLVELIRDRVSVESLRSGAVFEDPSIRLRNHVFLDLDRSSFDTIAWIHALHSLQVGMIAEADLRVRSAVDELIDGLLAVVPRGELVTGEQVETMLSCLDTFEQALPANLGRLLRAIEDLPQHQRQFVVTAASALFFSVTDLRAVCRSYIDACIVSGLPWTRSMLQAVGTIGRTRATTDRTAATIAGARAAFAVLVVGAVWIASGWVSGATAIVAVATTSALFALMPNPSTASWQIFGGCMAGWLTGFAFNFFILPRIDTFGLLTASVAIVVMVGSYVNTFAKTAILGLGFSLYFCFIVGITNPTVYDLSAYLDTGFALLCGIAVAAIAFSVLGPHAGDWVLAQYMKQIRRLITRDARDGQLDDLLYKFELGVRDFILTVSSSPLDARTNRGHLTGWAFMALEIGRAMIQVRLDTEQLRGTLPAGWPAELDAWLSALARVFASATPEAAQSALTATRRALDTLPLGPDIAVDPMTLIHYRMRALLHLTTLTLRDGALVHWQSK